MRHLPDEVLGWASPCRASIVSPKLGLRRAGRDVVTCGTKTTVSTIGVIPCSASCNDHFMRVQMICEGLAEPMNSSGCWNRRVGTQSWWQG